MNLKCPNCGCKEFFKTSVVDRNSVCGGVSDFVEAYACEKCGRVEIYVPQAELVKRRLRLEEEKAKQKAKEEKLAKEEALRKRLTELELILKDENITVKAHNEAKKEYEAIRGELHGDLRGIHR